MMNYGLIAVLLITVAATTGWQDHSKRSEKLTVTGITPEPDMVMVQGGRFAMGGQQNENEKPIHSVTLSSFKLAKYETTLAQWQQVMGSNPSGRTDCMDCPVTAVGWDDIQTFITKLNTLSGKTYRLPTEAEWEYAARGGIKSKGFDYAGSNDVNAVAWTSVNDGSTIFILLAKNRPMNWAYMICRAMSLNGATIGMMKPTMLTVRSMIRRALPQGRIVFSAGVAEPSNRLKAV